MTLLDLVLLLAVAAVVALLWSSLRAREAANDAMRRVCARHALLFLDDTVALASMRPMRDAEGRIVLRRTFTFDYSDTGHNRRSGSVTLEGAVVVDVQLDAEPPEVATDDSAAGGR